MTTVPGLPLCFALALAGCKTVQQLQQTQTDNRSANGESYNRSYQAEVTHRHHHSRSGEARDNWQSYDRADTADESAASSGQQAQGQSQNHARAGRRSGGRAVTSAPGQFDFYLLNLSWSPEFCHGHPDAAECSQHRAFTLHGLWPQNNDNTYPEDCSQAGGPSTPSQYADIYPDPALLQHEWQTHGTCSGLAPDAFLALDRRAEQSIHIPTGLSHLSEQGSLTPAQITEEFTQSNPGLSASSIAIRCGNNYLTAVEVCVDKNLKPISCSAVRTCGASQVRIPSPE